MINSHWLVLALCMEPVGVAPTILCGRGAVNPLEGGVLAGDIVSYLSEITTVLTFSVIPSQTSISFSFAKL